METILNLQYELDGTLSELCDEQERCEVIREYIKKLDTNDISSVGEFGSDMEWLNVERPLSLQKDLAGKIVVLDFFTYCCINCIHVLPTLDRLEKKFPPSQGLVIVGVHSAKFDNERLMSNVADAVLRYKIAHPVVNDPQARLWYKLGIHCWPTLVILSPSGKMLFILMGEGHEEALFRFCEVALTYFMSEGKIIPSTIPIQPLHDMGKTKTLLFPGKITCDSERKLLYVSDTGHHRVLIISFQGVIQDIIGGQEAGFRDGSFRDVLFHSPQGVIHYCEEDCLFVADTENHCVRKVDLQLKIVTTICGTGRHCSDTDNKSRKCANKAFSSPWDLCLAQSIGSQNGNVDTLYVAMAGLHQIWAFCLKDTHFHKIGPVKANTFMAVAGSGNEENRNNRFSMCASFAQPSGLTSVEADGKHFLVIADSESSSVRSLSLETGAVNAVVGGERDPTNLFAFGDCDGIGIEAKLQHPLGVSCSASGNLIFVVDSYNHKVKTVNLLTKECRTYAGSGQAGQKIGESLLSAEFNEPGGLAATLTHLYIADTNNHCIKVIDFETSNLSELPVISVNNSQSCDLTDNLPDISTVCLHEKLSPVTISPGGSVVFLLTLTFCDDIHLNEDAPQSWAVNVQEKDASIFKSVLKGNLDHHTEDHKIELVTNDNISDFSSEVELKLTLYLCHKDYCFMRERIWKVRISVSSVASKNMEISLLWNLVKY